jgi:hypothetical protein
LSGYKVAINFEGSFDEMLGADGSLSGAGANPATVTVYGPGGPDDVQTYSGLTVTSDPSTNPILKEGFYNAEWQQMATSVYAKNALTYRISMNGSYQLPVMGGLNKVTGKPFMSGVFIHRSNWSGKATHSSRGCLVICGTQYRRFEQQIGKISNIGLTLRRR